MNFKRLAVAAALGSATFSGSALAELSANVGVVSEYLFRGLAQSNGAAVQGGLDYAAESGFYVGTWASTINFASATGSGAEVDVYAGFGGEAGGTSYDIGVIYYWYAEEDEPGPQDPSLNTFEVYGSLGFGPFTLGAYAALGDYFGALNPDGSVADGAYGVSGELSLPMTDVLALDAKVALHGGEGNEAFTPDGDSYIEYVFGVSAESEAGLGFGLHLIATDIDNDDPKAVISGGYSFSL
jgi:uncharacterized protein (TIGR02001 family)